MSFLINFMEHLPNLTIVNNVTHYTESNIGFPTLENRNLTFIIFHGVINEMFFDFTFKDNNDFIIYDFDSSWNLCYKVNVIKRIKL